MADMENLSIAAPVQRKTNISLKPPALPAVTVASATSQDWLKSTMKSGELTRLRRGLYLPPQQDDGNDSSYQNYLRRIAAAAKQFPDDILSHESAAVLWGLSGFPLPKTVKFSTSNKGTINPKGVRRHFAHLPSGQVQQIQGIQITSLERTLVDCVRVLHIRDAIALADIAASTGIQSEACRVINSEMTNPRFRKKADAILTLMSPTSDSPPESYLRLLALHAGFPQPIPQLRVQVKGNTYYLDIGDLNVKIALEYDGEVKYTGSSVYFQEKIRGDNLRDAGWTVIRVTKHDFREPHVFIHKLRVLLSKRGYPPVSQLPVALQHLVLH